MACVCVAHLFLRMDLSLGCADISCDTLLKKTDFPFPSRYKWQVDSWLRLGLCLHFHLAVLGFCLAPTFAGPVHTPTVSVSSHVHQSYSIWKTPFLWSYPSLLAHTSSYLFFSLIPEARRWKHLFITECFKVSQSLYIVQLLVSLLIIIYHKKKPDEVWAMHLSMGRTLCHYGLFYCYVPSGE